MEFVVDGEAVLFGRDVVEYFPRLLARFLTRCTY